VGPLKAALTWLGREVRRAQHRSAP
jgi:hypothetical protein